MARRSDLVIQAIANRDYMMVQGAVSCLPQFLQCSTLRPMWPTPFSIHAYGHSPTRRFYEHARYPPVNAIGATKKARGGLRRLRGLLGINGIIGILTLTLLLVIAVVGPASVGNPLQMDVPQRLELPSSAHVMGTDEFGRDIFRHRVINGARISLESGIAVVVVGLGVGVPLGLGRRLLRRECTHYAPRIHRLNAGAARGASCDCHCQPSCLQDSPPRSSPWESSTYHTMRVWFQGLLRTIRVREYMKRHAQRERQTCVLSCGTSCRR